MPLLDHTEGGAIDADGFSIVDNRAGVTFGVELYVPWDAPEIFFCMNFIYLTRITHALKAPGVLLNSDIYIYMCTKINHTHQILRRHTARKKIHHDLNRLVAIMYSKTCDKITLFASVDNLESPVKNMLTGA